MATPRTRREPPAAPKKRKAAQPQVASGRSNRAPRAAATPATTPASEADPSQRRTRQAPARGGSGPAHPPAADLELRETETPGVYRNRVGTLVDRFGVMLSFAALNARHVEHETQVLGKEAETPAEVLKLAALDRTLPLSTRVDAAKHAAPYYDRKKPVAVDGGEDPETGKPQPILVKNLRGLSDSELLKLEELVKKAETAPVEPSA